MRGIQRKQAQVRWLAAVLGFYPVVGGSTVFLALDRGVPNVTINVAIFAIPNGVALIAVERARRARQRERDQYRP
jgi:hypothetical protein